MTETERRDRLIEWLTGTLGLLRHYEPPQLDRAILDQKIDDMIFVLEYGLPTLENSEELNAFLDQVRCQIAMAKFGDGWPTSRDLSEAIEKTKRDRTNRTLRSKSREQDLLTIGAERAVQWCKRNGLMPSWWRTEEVSAEILRLELLSVAQLKEYGAPIPKKARVLPGQS